jgi:hypothetical protein
MISKTLSTFTVFIYLWLSLITKLGVNGLFHNKLLHSTVFTGLRYFSLGDGSNGWSRRQATGESFAEDSVIRIKPKAIERLQELKDKQPNPKDALVLRLGVRNGGCSGAFDYVSLFTYSSRSFYQ